MFTESLRLICTRDARDQILVVKAVHMPYEPLLESQKNHALPARYLWQFIGPTEVPPEPDLGKTLDQLFMQLAQQQLQKQAERQRSLERKNFAETWNQVLQLQQRRLDAVPKLHYTSVTPIGEQLTFVLAQAAPDDLDWPDNAPVALLDAHQQHPPMFMGHVVSIIGAQLRVVRDATNIARSTEPTKQIPPSGLIGVHQQEAQAALERQKWAIGNIKAGATANPRLPDVLLDLNTAEFEESNPELEFFQLDLAIDQQQAVRQALAARDLFLLQGPPGTGKTTTLAEIILQILKAKPDARILVASQSNVAVNHVLARVASLQPGQAPEIVRIGRAEKIGQGAEVWTIEQRLQTWRSEVIARTDGVVKDLKARVREQRRMQKALAPMPLLDDLEQSKEWLTELGDQADDLATTLELVRSILPEEARGEPDPQLTMERKRLLQIISNLLAPDAEAPRSREQQLLDVVERWRKIFGKQNEFARPILARARILAATCLISGGFYLKDQVFDWAIIDEAGRATAPELLVPLVRARRAILVGDERQLPPMLDEDLSNKELAKLGTSREDLSESLFAVLVSQGKDLPTVQMLTLQHRMHPAIGQLVSEVFYEGKLTHAVHSWERDHGLPWLSRPVTWFSTARLERHFETRQDRSYYNRAEVEGIRHLLHRMESTYMNLGTRRAIAVITPYNAQIAELEAAITPSSTFWRSLTIEISTVDAFQGRDRDIVLYSPVRSNRDGTLGFLRDRRRLNVALSRAREALLIVGDIWTLEHGRTGVGGNPYHELIQYVRTHPDDCQIEDLTLEAAHE